MNTLQVFIKNHQQKIVLFFGFALVAGISFGLGRFGSLASPSSDSAVRVEQAFVSPDNYTPIVSGTQSSVPASLKDPSPTNVPGALNCEGRIKGASSMIYHLPGDPFYKRTTKPIACFDTEAQATAAGFKKSGK